MHCWDLLSERAAVKILKGNLLVCCALLFSGCVTTNDEIRSKTLIKDHNYTKPYEKKTKDVFDKIHYQEINNKKYIVRVFGSGESEVKFFYSSQQKSEAGRYAMMQVSMSSEMGFDHNSSELKSSVYGTLNSVSLQLKKHPGVYAVIVGHTDSDGTDKYNYRLSARRADSTARYIINRGASNERIYRIAAGEDYPVASNTSQINKTKNRRVDIFLSTDKALIIKYFREHTCVTDYCRPRKLNVVGYNKNIQPSSKVKMPVEFQKEITTPEHAEKRDVIVNTKTRDTHTGKITYREVPGEINTIRNLNVKAITRELPRDIDSEYLVLDDDQYRQGL